MKPLVSILIPAHNAEKWIADTIRSAVAQTWERKEIIVVDDGSTDQTLGIARQFESESVCVIRQENQGAAAARNKAFSLCHGDYIQWLDADDLLASDKIAKQMEALDRGGSRQRLLSSSFGQFMYRPYRARFTPSALWCDLSATEFLLRKLTYRVFMQTAVWLVSRELTEAAGPWDTSMISDDDGEYFCRILLASDGIRFVQDARVYYRSVGTMRLSYVGGSNRKLEALWRSMQLHIAYLRSLEDSEKVRAACLKYLQNYLIDFYPLRLDIAEQMHKVAKELGGQLHPPHLSWKYSWIKTLFGWSWAKRAQLFLPSVKWSLIRFWDKALFRIETRGVARVNAGI
jgi:glycosyltransferase involved in cell wall biosynthesis